jgi:hypothetical protein
VPPYRLLPAAICGALACNWRVTGVDVVVCVSKRGRAGPGKGAASGPAQPAQGCCRGAVQWEGARRGAGRRQRVGSRAGGSSGRPLVAGDRAGRPHGRGGGGWHAARRAERSAGDNEGVRSLSCMPLCPQVLGLGARYFRVGVAVYLPRCSAGAPPHQRQHSTCPAWPGHLIADQHTACLSVGVGGAGICERWSDARWCPSGTCGTSIGRSSAASRRT